MNRRVVGRRSSGGAFIMLVILAVLGVLLWRGYVAIFHTSAVVQEGALGNQYTAEAIIVRNETRQDADSVTRILYYADEGSLVYKSNKIAEIYSSGYSQTEVNKLETVRTQIKDYHLSVLLTGYVDPQLDRLDAEIMTRTREIRKIVQGLSEGNLLNLRRQLQAAMTARQTYLRQKYPNDQRLTALYSDETSQKKKIESWTIAYVADHQCIVSFYTDGYEDMLSGRTVEDLTPADVRRVLDGIAPEKSVVQRARTPVFRTIEQRGFYVVLLSNDKNWNPVNGQPYKLQLEGFDDTVYDATVSSSTRTGGDLIVRLYVDADVRPVISVRTIRVNVGEQYANALQVPSDSLYSQGGQMGVVTVDKLFIPVTVLANDSRYATIQPITAGALRVGQKVKRF
ncbi:MAG TPA: HlyD family efflux transporter periplasmic adaptor subunit [Clostridia bacterium]|nr:HlyD family efflux transporter periplasmic adaptor subunit [Clostridia bacterium]